MKKILIFALMLFAGGTAAQPTIWGGAKLKFTQGDTAFISTAGALKDWVITYVSGGGTVSNVSSGNLSPLFTVGIANPTTTPAFTFTLTNAAANTYFGNATGGATSPSYTAAGAMTDVDDTNVTLSLSANASTSLLRAVSITAGWTGLLAASRGGTANGFTAFSGPTTATKTFTLPDASATILTSNAAVTAAQGGTGQTVYVVGDLLQANTTTSLAKLAAVATGNVLISGGVGVVSSWGKVGLTTHVSGILPGANGGTNNGFMDFTGPASTLKTFTLPNASATILTSNAAVTVAQGGTGASTLSGTLFGNGTSAITATALGGDVTLYGSNGTAPLYYALGITTTSAAVGFARASGTLNLNIPDADASFRGMVSTGTQTLAGAKTFSGAVTVSGLTTSNAGLSATATASVAAVNAKGVADSDYREITTTSTIAETDNRVIIGTIVANITVNLPACNATRDGWEFRFKKKGADAFAFILDPNSTETIDGATTLTVYSKGSKVTCKCLNGTGWETL